ncbi:MAG: VOC family protein [Alphaproteobacteria bacterium]|nr:VOC family protein [Pseudomonadota bacterium]TDI66153.1 MAG: VOC family protein [Alphaproteobacteria bacterium]
MAKLRHIAMSVPDPHKAADFYCEAFDMKRVGERDSTLAKGVFVSDGVITVAFLNFKTDAQGPKEFVGLHHIGFWVDDIREAEEKVEKAGAQYLMGRPEQDQGSVFYEEKFRDPNGVIFDITHVGWDGSVKDVVPAEEASG